MLYCFFISFFLLSLTSYCKTNCLFEPRLSAIIILFTEYSAFVYNTLKKNLIAQMSFWCALDLTLPDELLICVITDRASTNSWDYLICFIRARQATSQYVDAMFLFTVHSIDWLWVSFQYKCSSWYSLPCVSDMFIASQTSKQLI